MHDAKNAKIEVKSKKPRTSPPKDETPVDRFRRLAGARLDDAIGKINLIGNCFGTLYSYTPEQVTIIEKELAEATSKAVANLRAGKKEDKGRVNRL